MQRARLHNNLSRSMLLLPFCCVAALLLWWFPQGGYSHHYAIGLALCAVTAYVIMETSNANALIRVRARSVSSAWMLFMICIGFLHSFHWAAISGLCIAISYYLLFRTYQASQPVVDVFHTFVMVGVASLFLPQTLYLVPFYIWHLMVFMRVFSFRCFWAGILGLMLPFWFAFNACFLTDHMLLVWDWWTNLTTIYPIHLSNYADIELPVMLTWIVIGTLAFWTGIQFMRHSFNDKIRVRMVFYIYILQSFVILLMALLQPQHAEDLLYLMLVTCTPFIAHYFTLVTNWGSLIVFLLFVTALVAIAMLTMAHSYLPTHILSII